ncbi:hypothetical protein [Pseudogemmobacter bohemicus]
MTGANLTGTRPGSV